jgi:hypothetical protein
VCVCVCVVCACMSMTDAQSKQCLCLVGRQSSNALSSCIGLSLTHLGGLGSRRPVIDETHFHN